MFISLVVTLSALNVLVLQLSEVTLGSSVALRGAEELTKVLLSDLVGLGERRGELVLKPSSAGGLLERKQPLGYPGCQELVGLFALLNSSWIRHFCSHSLLGTMSSGCFRASCKGICTCVCVHLVALCLPWVLQVRSLTCCWKKLSDPQVRLCYRERPGVRRGGDALGTCAAGPFCSDALGTCAA